MKLIMVWSWVLGLGSASLLPAQSAAEASVPVEVTPEYVNQLAEEMRVKNPALAAAAARTNAAAANLAAVRTWEDPMASAGGMLAEEMMRAEDGDLIYGVEQKLPLWGKPKLARNAARAALDTEMANLDYGFQTRRSELAKRLYEAAAAERIVALGAEDVAWLDTLARTLESRYRAGMSSLVEVVQAQNEKARRADQVKVETEKLRQQHFLLNRLLSRSPETPWPKLQLPEPAPPIVYSQQLVDLALQNEPRLKVMRSVVLQAEAGVRQAQRERYPDVSVGLEGRNYTGNGDFRQGMALLSINLPWFNAGKYRSQERREAALKQAAELDITDSQLELHAEVHGLSLRIEAARREALLYRDEITPRNETALASARAAWESGSGMFRDLLETRRALLDASIMETRATAQQYIDLAELVLCCGLGDLEALLLLQPILSGTTNSAPTLPAVP